VVNEKPEILLFKSYFLYLVCRPPPQVTEHWVNGDQRLHPPSKTVESYNNQMQSDSGYNTIMKDNIKMNPKISRKVKKIFFHEVHVVMPRSE
jgi:hypothetical protein